ncbi:GNAT family N-acetyltransferase [Planococcus shenhongbingii]|uniref:GNAT family N-acetyltransferase n=1 Tax=Planococcus shenhongbingii TaxID=3058398 RepID=A0ABT8NFY7_9BACL|nr:MULTISPECIES: GNAT family N-acetyltransferase [unclassified Planococcus (in: firmicutes)]MDN7246577.1 GNAT family N-acetyltransferase [Planococcus sp. N017]WKA60404.1 GNAT family N-acetyltransferase [Planococcus sp. N016]
MIRAGTIEDIASVQEIAYISWNDTYEGIIPPPVQKSFLDKSYSTPMMEMRLKKTIVLLAMHENEPIGFANFTKVDQDGDSELIALYLKPEYQRNGYGRQLLNSGLSYLLDGSQLSVYVESENTKGRKFYEATGFKLVEEFEEFFEGHLLQTAKYVYDLKTPTL